MPRVQSLFSSTQEASWVPHGPRTPGHGPNSIGPGKSVMQSARTIYIGRRGKGGETVVVVVVVLLLLPLEAHLDRHESPGAHT